MVVLHFEGWFQCRLAGDPDPADEPRGISGAPFALVGEPDLDRVIRLQRPADDRVIRTHSPPLGVQVTQVDVNGSTQLRHPMLGARVDLLDGAKFIEMNGVVAPANHPIIEPFHLQIAQAPDLVLRRKAVWDPQHPDKTCYDVPPEALAPRQTSPDLSAVEEVLNASGIVDVFAYLDWRHQHLKRDLAALEEAGGYTTNPDPTLAVRKAGLRQRLDAFALLDAGRAKSAKPNQDWDWRAVRNVLLLQGRANFAFTLNALTTDLVDPKGVLGTLDTTKPWRIQFWTGAWDNDVLCGFMKGSLYLQ